MKTDDIVKHLHMQDKNLEYYKKKVSELEQQIYNIKHISENQNTIRLKLKKETYSREEILTAYNRTLKYEGISDHRAGGLIIDTMIEFLNETHESLEKNG